MYHANQWVVAKHEIHYPDINLRIPAKSIGITQGPSKNNYVNVEWTGCKKTVRTSCDCINEAPTS